MLLKFFFRCKSLRNRWRFLHIPSEEPFEDSFCQTTDKNPDATEVVSSDLDPYLETDLYQNVPENLSILKVLKGKRNETAHISTHTEMNPGSIERRKVFYEIQKKGDFEYNSHNENQLTGVRYQEGKNWMPCPYCKGYYSKKNLRNHIRLICRPQKKQNRNSNVLSRTLQPRILNIANDSLKRVIPKLRDDGISEIIRHDRMIIICGNMWCTKYSSSSHHQKMIRYRLRHLAKILQILKQFNDRVTDSSSIQIILMML
ncbi:hypothetical protein JTB14_012398 [Gonioctena quinquepunctata]|nr:hypothetical protein JTB14_012398 [Gonioctena quinquepunctata]